MHKLLCNNLCDSLHNDFIVVQIVQDGKIVKETKSKIFPHL